MNARNQLNQINLVTSVFLATIFGLIVESWIGFAFMACILVAIDLSTGAIRVKSTTRR
jgi:hypothetical protein